MAQNFSLLQIIFILLSINVCSPALVVKPSSSRIVQVPSLTQASIIQKRQEMLKLINQVRLGLNKNLPKLYIDERLNGLAQGHSVDMIKRKFFDHLCPDGKGVAQRAKDIGFNFAVGENIAISGTVQEAHNSLMKSPGHYNNTINPDWTRCGIGFQVNKTGRLYTTIVFSTRDLIKSPISQQNLIELQKQISEYILSTNKQLKQQDKNLSDHIKKWYSNKSDSMTIWEYLKSVSYSKPTIGYSNTAAKVQWIPNLINKIKMDKMFVQNNANFKVYGVNLRQKGPFVDINIVYATK